MFYRRNLPHWHPDDVPLFVTWRLYGSMPSAGSGRSFVEMDRELDEARCGPVWLGDPRIASVVVRCLRYTETDLRLCDLRAWVVMSNHVHVVLQPHAPLWRITKAVKGFSAREANQILGRTGQPFWQHESFDHWVRNRDELEEIVRYVEANPVAPGLVARPEDWPWSSASVEQVS